MTHSASSLLPCSATERELGRWKDAVVLAQIGRAVHERRHDVDLGLVNSSLSNLHACSVGFRFQLFSQAVRDCKEPAELDSQ